MAGYIEKVPISLINLIPEPVFFLANDFRIVNLNTTAEKLFKIKKKSIIGKSFSLLCSNITQLTDPTSDEYLKSLVGEQMISWEPIILDKSGKVTQYLLVGTFKDSEINLNATDGGKKKSADSVHDAIANLSKNLTGQLINKNKDTLEYVKNTYHYMENIIAEIPVSIYWMNKKCIYLGCSNSMAKLLNLNSRYDIVGKTYADLYDKISASHYMKADKKVMSKGVSLTLEEPLYHPDGTKEIYLSKKVPLTDSDGNIIGMLGISVDITERKKMEAELTTAKENAEAYNYIMIEFIANMGHILVTPLSKITGVATVLLYGYADKYLELKPQFETLMEGCIDWDKAYSQVIKGTSITDLELNVETFSINAELHNIVHIMEPSIGSKNIKLILSSFALQEEDNDLIESDKLKFHLVLTELIFNAIKFTEQGSITIPVYKKDGWFHIEISDTGIGIPSDKLEFIFKQFTMLSRAQKYGANFKGVGAGLFLTEQRAKLLHAKISVTSEVGKGSTFTLSIPVKFKEI